jgi:uncharacterized protein (TIGR02646 family)
VIKLQKLDRNHPIHGPAIKKLQRFHEQHLEAITRGDEIEANRLAERYRTVKAALMAETHNKCAYCETKVQESYAGDVEHMRPKSRNQQRALDYDNLTFACSWCNTKKGHIEYDDGLHYLDPYIDEPKDRLRFFGPMLKPVNVGPEVIRAKRLIDDLDLNRTALLERRVRRYEDLENLEGAYRDAKMQAIRDFAEEKILAAQTDDRVDALFARQFFRTAGMPTC